MNRKETLIWSIIDNVIVVCDIPRADGTHSISIEDIVGKSREENVVMAIAFRLATSETTLMNKDVEPIFV